MIIVLEGPDMAGKTTLSRNLTHVFRDRVVVQLKRGPLLRDPMLEYLESLQDLIYTPPSEVVVIMDRWHVGELIYGPLLRGGSKLSLAQAAYIEKVIQTFGASFLHVTADIPTLEDRYDIRGDTLIKKEWLQRISDDYWRYVSTRPHWASVVVGHNGSIPAGMTSATVSHNWLSGRYIGPALPRVLLLGDKRNDERLEFPFVPFPATSGHWLFRSLLDADVDVMKVGIVNANELTSEQLYRLWGNLGSPPVVVLGNEAENAWKASQTVERVPYRKVPHPQYMRRFQHQQTRSYGAEIKKAMR